MSFIRNQDRLWDIPPFLTLLHTSSHYCGEIRICEAFADGGSPFAEPVEVDEAYFGGWRKNMSKARRKELADTGRGAVGKTAVVGVKDGKTKKVRAKVVEATDKTKHWRTP